MYVTFLELRRPSVVSNSIVNCGVLLCRFFFGGGGCGILALLFMCGCICFMFYLITFGFNDAADNREAAIALAARWVSQGDCPAWLVTIKSKEAKKWNFSSLFFFFWSSSNRNQITTLVCFLFSQSQSSLKPFSLLLSTLNCDLWLK